MRLLPCALALVALGTPALAEVIPDTGGVTVLRGSSTPQPVFPLQSIAPQRTVIEYRYVPTYVPIYSLPTARVVFRHNK